jgi:hypothetical protein
MTSNSDDQASPTYWFRMSPEDRLTELLQVAGFKVESWQRGRWVLTAIDPEWIEHASSGYQQIQSDIARRVAAIKATLDNDQRSTRTMTNEPETVSIKNPLWVLAIGVWTLAICVALLVALNYGLINPSDSREPTAVELAPFSSMTVSISDMPAVHNCWGLAEDQRGDCLFLTVTDVPRVEGRIETYSYDR